ncbi:g11849 [Coccomyxa viridis]|uniref:G11849 protein n=1 Tax=Coccomyxa viridis TaxID=1274662 RepID=A0ABP1G8Y9_9CHLO
MPHPIPTHFAAKPFFIGAGQPLQAPPIQRCRLSASQSTSSAAFHSNNLADQHSASQQASRPRAVASLEQETTAVSSNVQPLSKGLHSAPRLPKSKSNWRKPRLRVAVDVDEVLGRFLHSLNKFCEEEYGLLFDIPDYSVYEFAKIWKCTTDESNRIVHDFFESQHFAAGILPIPGAYHSLQRLRGSCDLVVVTSRQHCIRQPTLAWVQEHFPDVFREVHFGNHWALEGKSKAKSEICRDIGATVLIDDNPRYAVECASAGIDVLLYDWNDSYPWSKTADGPVHPQIQRVRNWTEVEEALARLGAAQEAGALQERQ